jgi:eukaryotic-like serine/threonine-protein kinase
MSPTEKGPGRSLDDIESWLRDAARSPSMYGGGPRLPIGAQLLAGRFSIKRCLGQGGMGVVYEALDRNTKSNVALKMLSHGDAAGIYRFKQEFRSLADVRHDNLVTLHELFAENGRWFFTMDVVEGQTFLEYVRTEPAASFQDTLALDASGPASNATAPSTPPSAAPGVDLERLRSALLQLVAGIQTIHAAGKLHRDLKSSNVLVTGDGRVVILDFGLVSDEPRDERADTIERGIAGTPAYMAPEQANGERATAVSDWYALGAMLYEALCGDPPFTGRVDQILRAKIMGEPAPLSTLAPSAPADLAELCTRLLCRDPAQRPGGHEILQCLGTLQGSPVSTSVPRSRSERTFVDREHESATLHDAFEELRQSQPRVVFIQGASGMGKTALVERFIEEARARSAVALAGRCYERESVPYKALDGAIDALTRYLGHLPPTDAARLVPRDIHELARIFPVLSRVDVVARTRGRPLDAADPSELRRRAFGALRQLLLRISDHVRVILFIDDLQWMDDDSVRLLVDLLSPPDPPPLLLLGTYRIEDGGSVGPLEGLLSAVEGIHGVIVRQVCVGPLDGRNARALADALLGDGATADIAGSISDECRGSPFFLRELVHWLHQGGAPESMTLDRVLSTRIAALEGPERRLLDTISVAARPVELEIVLAAAGVADASGALRRLQAARLIRGASGGQRRLTAYHDRVREKVSTLLGPATLRDIHGALARAVESAAEPDPELLAHHLAQSGEPVRAAQLAGRAGDRANEALAFDRAARLYRMALTLGDQPNDLELREKLARALSSLGRSKDAADAYLEAARVAGSSHAGRAAAFELRRLAAEHYLVSGEIERGTEVLSALLAEVGLRFPGNRTYAIAGILKNLSWLRLRGIRAGTRPDPNAVAADQLKLLLSGYRGYATFSPIPGSYFALEALTRSLRAGYVKGIILGLDYYGVMCAYSGKPRDERRAARILDESERLSTESEDPVLRARIGFARGVAATALGRFAESLETLDRSVVVLEPCVGVDWEHSVSDHCRIQALIWLGRLRRAHAELLALARRSEHNGDRFSQLVCATLDANLKLATGHPAEARSQAVHVLSQWGTRDFTFQHLFSIKAAIWCDLYEGAVESAYARFHEMMPALRASGLLSVQLMRAETAFLEGSIELARRASGDARASSACIRRAAGWLEKTGRPYAEGYAATLRAGAAQLAGQSAEARDWARQAVVAFDRAQMQVHVAALCMRLGDLEGRALMAAEGIAEPERWSRIYLPDW